MIYAHNPKASRRLCVLAAIGPRPRARAHACSRAPYFSRIAVSARTTARFNIIAAAYCAHQRDALRARLNCFCHESRECDYTAHDE
ncbi:hypothetical protein EVAR_41731_1 [Eumeta japonica]|uniref:Uncharacterized protein n=1 Tax=Eumeta variegata TaxID=151549 RepID=A0A4C1XDI3_EUMVA|nr:hypothetical protein EVAR_41731_1 [Eumeta japonica]